MTKKLINSSLPKKMKLAFYCSFIFIYAMIMICIFQMQAPTLRFPNIISPAVKSVTVTHDGKLQLPVEDDMQWIDTTGITMLKSHGNQTACIDVIYTADNRSPTGETFVSASWESLSYVGASTSTLSDRTPFYYIVIFTWQTLVSTNFTS